MFRDPLSFNLVLNCAPFPVQVMCSGGQSEPEALIFHQDYLRYLQLVFIIIPRQNAARWKDLPLSFQIFLSLLNTGKREEFFSSTS